MMINSKIILSIVSLAAMAVLAACNSPVYTQKEVPEKTSLADLETFAWLPNIDTAENSIYQNEIVMNHLRMKVNEEMETRGYTLNTEDPDIVVMTHLNIVQRTDRVYDPVSQPVYYEYHYYYDDFKPATWYDGFYTNYYSIPEISTYEVETVEYVDGTFVIDIIEPQKKELLWRGYTTEHIGPSSIESEITENVEQIFEEYPVQPVMK